MPPASRVLCRPVLVAVSTALLQVHVFFVSCRGQNINCHKEWCKNCVSDQQTQLPSEILHESGFTNKLKCGCMTNGLIARIELATYGRFKDYFSSSDILEITGNRDCLLIYVLFRHFLEMTEEKYNVDLVCILIFHPKATLIRSRGASWRSM